MATFTILTVALELAIISSSPYFYSRTLSYKSLISKAKSIYASSFTKPTRTPTIIITDFETQSPCRTLPTKPAHKTSTVTKQTRSALKQHLKDFSYLLKTLYLFSSSDLKTVLLPWTLFGLVHAYTSSLFHLSTISPSALGLVARLPLVLIYLILLLLPFNISNQCSPSSIAEDAVNKPSRPIPSGRITAQQCTPLVIALYVLTLSISILIGGTRQAIVAAVLSYLYNDCRGGDHWLSRHVLNGLAFSMSGSGAMEVALGFTYGARLHFTPQLTIWLALVSATVACGIQIADVYDIEGDKAVGRATLPIVIGEEMCRWSIAVSTVLSTVVATRYWGVGIEVAVALMGLAGTIAKRTLRKRDNKEDRRTYKLWGLWLLGLYCLPLAAFNGL